MNTLHKAVEFIENGDIEKGLALLEQYETKGSDEEKYECARYYHKLGFIEKALAIAEDLHALYPEESEITLFLAELYVDMDEEDKAIEVLNTVQEEDELYVQALLLAADLYQMQGFDEVAEQKLLLAKAALPEEPVIDFGLGEFYSSRGDYVKAVPYYEAVAAIDPEMGGVSINLRLAESLSSIGKWEEAIVHYEEGLQQHEDLHSMFGYAFTLYQAGLYQRAIPVFTKVKELDYEYGGIYRYLAKCYEEEGMLEESCEALKEGLKVNEFSPELYSSLAKIYMKTGRVEEAEDTLRQAAAIDPSNLEVVLGLIQLLRRYEKYEEIVDVIETVTEMGEHDPQLEWNMAFAKKQLEEYSDALNLYRNAYTSFKNDIDFLEEYGYFLLEEGLRKEAKEVLTTLLQLDPTQVQIEELLYNLEDLQ
ncbi:tetratricopeptide repeat protein [Bacillus sp. 165]|uniref:tetratricopeptide repeat protein n=1 Tax=Bacillus sp. 165 TaxID=1529117 RepID=UPI001ADA0B41|nr:tetratricopeptide repeat protein [Bacillus sp. 165]MBO9128236.1 tetratricopeptide repeat protein [Bacillus sp. 165]